MPSKRQCLGRMADGTQCRALVIGTSRCPDHGWSGNWPTTTPESRGYGAEWKELRKRILIRDGYRCVQCGAKATDVDHTIPKSKGGSNDASNLRSLCRDCHRAKTKREMGHV